MAPGKNVDTKPGSADVPRASRPASRLWRRKVTLPHLPIAEELLPLAMQRPDQRGVKPAAVTSIDP